jgi:hypothetical protein
MAQIVLQGWIFSSKKHYIRISQASRSARLCTLRKTGKIKFLVCIFEDNAVSKQLISTAAYSDNQSIHPQAVPGRKFPDQISASQGKVFSS